ncbi:SMI1/KNR4 family protein [Nonomuraea phyllanthi]|uniref:SMI1/KNR4 family protein n=1 Tax=Nonomuraea phyllanthi TaxID=2219224 RepID=A0A5C4VXV0_9ACTN|nr:SMI1/KNR4 family protein [Nonomuraea phyllanthi]KAB8190632.1 SMI1/KNR4 family protein [Nonomuraea phyllanthi]
MVQAAVPPIVEAIVAQAPPGWTRAVLSSAASTGGVSVAGGYSVRGGSRLSGHVPAPFSELMRLAEALREMRGWRRTSLEIACLPSGQYELVAFADTVTSLRGRAGGFQVVLDPGYELPQPGMTAQEEGTAAPAGDPDLAVARFRAYMERGAAILGRPQPLTPPASAAALEEAERRIGRPLPADLRALYEIANGDDVRRGNLRPFGNAAWLGLESVTAVHEDIREPMPPGWELGWDRVVFDADPPDTVRRCGGHPAWLPFATGEDGNFLAVDMSPARYGRPGQVIRVGRDHDDGPAYLADSVTSLLGHYLDLLERGEYEQDEYEDGIFLPDPDDRPGHGKIVGELPRDIPPGIQAMHINDAASPVDLTPLTAAHRLRRLHLNRCATGDLAPIRSLPVESLRVTLAGGDLTPLEGHPHLTALDLGAAAPVDLAPLRSVPNLRSLDVSRADVHDLTVLTDLPDLRYLALTTRQWHVLLEQGKAPVTLAAARLADDTAALDEALAWASCLGVDTRDSVHVTGVHTV